MENMIMDKRDLKINPMDDSYDSGPSVLDKASALLVDQINKLAESLAHEDEPQKVEEPQEPVNVQYTSITTTNEPRTTNPFHRECPQFDMGDAKQAILKQQWSVCKNRWDFQQTFQSIHETINVQLIIFASVVNIVRNLSIEHFVAIQPTEHEMTKLFYMVANMDMAYGDGVLTRGEINMETTVTEAVTKKININLNLEAISHMKKFNDDDVIQKLQLVRLLSRAVTVELYKDIYQQLISTNHIVSFEFIKDTHTSLQLYKEANDIATRSYRGCGNKLIVSNSVLASLIRAESIEVVDDPSKRYGHVSYVGNLSGGGEVFNDASMPDGESLVIYKGISQADAGLIYCPYNMLVPGGVIVDHSNFQPKMSVFTQSSTYQNNLSNYVSHVTIKNIGYAIEDDKMITELFKEKPLQSALIAAAGSYSPHVPLTREGK